MPTVLPISAIVPTLNRASVLKTTLTSLAGQEFLPAELIVIDGSRNDETQAVVHNWKALAGTCDVTYQRATHRGAAAQRNQGVAVSTQPFIWFFDDDIVFEPHCVERLWSALETDHELGGVNAMITNQRYIAPGVITRTLFRLLDSKVKGSRAGKCLGPALNVLPEDDPKLPDVVPVEWLNTTCTIYRRKAIPNPPFDSHFTGYSFMEDVALSLIVGRTWNLANARTARIYHDSQTAGYKEDKAGFAKMELVNRHFVMTKVLGRTSISDYAKLMLLEAFGLITPLVQPGAWKSLPALLRGKGSGIRTLLGSRKHSSPILIEEFQSGSAKEAVK